jgi:hypothetical protein
MELAAGEALFDRMAYESPEDFAELLEDAVLVMRERQAALRGVPASTSQPGMSRSM